METITKKQLIKEIADEAGMQAAHVSMVVEAFMNKIIDTLAAGNRLEFREFAVFEVKKRAGRLARNPKTGDKVEVPAKMAVAFKPGRKMKQEVAKLPAE